LYHHFFREDLAKFCADKKLISHGSKKELVERIRRYWDDKLEDKDKRKPPKEKEIKKKEIYCRF